MLNKRLELTLSTQTALNVDSLKILRSIHNKGRNRLGIYISFLLPYAAWKRRIRLLMYPVHVKVPFYVIYVILCH